MATLRFWRQERKGIIHTYDRCNSAYYPAPPPHSLLTQVVEEWGSTYVNWTSYKDGTYAEGNLGLVIGMVIIGMVHVSMD